MSGELSFRHGTTNDLQQFKELGIITYGQYEKLLGENWHKLGKMLSDTNTWTHLLKTSTPLVCEINNKIVGMAFLVSTGNPTDIYPEDATYIRMVGVHPDHTGKGIAKKLTWQCIDLAKQNGEKTIMLHTSEYMDSARHIYESCGFTILKEIPPRFGKKYWLYKMDL